MTAKRAVDVHLSRTSPKGGRLQFRLIDVDTPSGGVGGWQTVDRNRARQGLSWSGTPALVYTLPLRLDGFGTGPKGKNESVEAHCRTLMSWGQPIASNGTILDPPVLGLTGNVLTSASIKWVITNLTWGAMVRDDNGILIQRDVTIELTEYVAAPVAKTTSSTGNRRAAVSSPAAVAKKKIVAIKQPTPEQILGHKGSQ